jgi:hypothetical protein
VPAFLPPTRELLQLKQTKVIISIQLFLALSMASYFWITENAAVTYFFFNCCTVHLDIIKALQSPTDALFINPRKL